MKLQKAVKQELVHITIGTFALVAGMLAVFFFLDKLSVTAVISGVLGGLVAVGNFLMLGFTVQKVAADSARGNQIMRLSYAMRMLAMAVWLVLAMGLKSWFYWPCAMLPLLFPRITIAIMHLLGMYKPAPKQPGGEGGE